MSLVACRECGGQVSDRAPSCPQCGSPLGATSAHASAGENFAWGRPYSGFWKRVLAALVDAVLTAIGGGVIGFVLGAVMGAAGMEQGTIVGFNFLIGGVLGWLYYALMESSSSQATLGKSALGIKVTDMDGNRISFGKATGRHFGKLISGLILCIGYLMVAFTAKKQGLHDLMAGTLVVNR